MTAPNVAPPAMPEIAQFVTEVIPPPVEPAGVTEMVAVAAPAAPAGKTTVVTAAFGAGEYVNVGDVTGAAGQVIVAVNAGSAAPAGLSVCAQLSVEVVAAA